MHSTFFQIVESLIFYVQKHIQFFGNGIKIFKYLRETKNTQQLISCDIYVHN